MSRRRSSKPPCKPRKRAGGSTSPRQIVDDYIRNYRLGAEQETQFFARQPSLHKAVQWAAQCKRPDGKRHSHQHRIPSASLEDAYRRLLVADLAGCRAFDALHDAIADRITDIHMIGELTIYDITHRIGAFLGLAPTSVYLHRGTRDGAVALGFDGKRKTIDVAELPDEFHRLTPSEIEDCLCIYKDEIAAVVRGEPADLRGGSPCGTDPRVC